MFDNDEEIIAFWVGGILFGLTMWGMYDGWI